MTGGALTFITYYVMNVGCAAGSILSAPRGRKRAAASLLT